MLRAALLTLLILIVLPATASAACRTAPVADVWYDTPAVQVWAKGNGIVACVRATGVERVVRPPHSEASVSFDEVVGERWLVTRTESGYWSDNTSVETLSIDMLDLYTGDTVTDGMFSLPGGFVVSDPSGIVAHYADGRTEVLSPEFGDDFALHGRRLYWRTDGKPRTVLLNLPAAGPALAPQPLQRARTMTRCAPKAGARLVARYRRVVVTRVGKAAYVCFNGRTTALGNATRFQSITTGDVAYTRPGFIGYVDASTGVKRELPRASGPLVASLWTIAARDRKGVLRAWGDARRPVVLTREPASEIAVTPFYAFWMAADGKPRVKGTTR
ncbi:hypothetical protein C8N24_2148 [Solirubrobacter pauli]|uniref:WG repeat protein n=1 Tax=Solirubrobacter pauli TaxID=166793 RepID=A0A660LH59_9ACTN|nr:hypothetical protein [Solirubrobacter pauli]RKQ92304.1 hypothetical protein C8N24_2148 [Solirubrobacter pauli]